MSLDQKSEREKRRNFRIKRVGKSYPKIQLDIPAMTELTLQVRQRKCLIGRNQKLLWSWYAIGGKITPKTGPVEEISISPGLWRRGMLIIF